MNGSPVAQPFNLLGWIEAHAADFEPPVSNKVVWSDADHIFMIIRGPNARSDFHVDPYDEIFYQLRGTIRVDLLVDGRRQERVVREGDVLLVPGGMPHSPLRPADTWGLVIERPRPVGVFDELVWMCETCDKEVHRVRFHVADIETELAAALRAYNADASLRTCPDGHVNAIPSAFQL